METLSGKTALAEIDKVLTRARSLLAGVSGEFVSARDRISRLQQREIAIFARLARLRLLAIEQGTLVSELEKADRDVAGILGDREQAATDLNNRIRAAEAALAESETRRKNQQAVVAAAGDALDAAEAKAQAALEADEAWQRQLGRTERADFIAHQAEEKAAAARNDRTVKGKPYEQDPLFSYLWERGYGTSKYRAIPLTRWLDGMVAGLCDYESARQNYSLLIEIPIRLDEHAERMRRDFDHEAEALAELERAAAKAAGVPELGDRLEEAQDDLADVDERIVEREHALRKLIADRKGFASGEDEYYRNCLDVLGNAMRQKGLPLLEADAARTATPEDNDLVQELAFVRSERAEIEQDLAEYRRLYDRENDRVGGLENVRQRFKARRYDDALSEFVNGALITLVLNQFLSGMARSGDVWETIKRQQRTKQVHANPNFGTLKFPRAGKHGPWRMPGGFGRGGGFGGGGFKTGGGFRGGGFKTGGGF